MRRPLIHHWHCVVALVAPFNAPGADVVPVGSTVQPQQPLVLVAQLVFNPRQSRDQPVGLPTESLVVDFQVSRAEGLFAHQARPDSSAFPPRANAAFHLLGSVRVLNLKFRLQELLHDFAEHRVPAQQRSGVEHLSALGAGVLAFMLGPVPVVLDTVQAVAVSAGDRHRVPQDLQADGATKLLLLYRNRRSCHFLLTLKGNVNRQRWAWLTGVLITASQVSGCC